MTYATISELINAGGISAIEDGTRDDIYISAASFEPRSTTLSAALARTYFATWAFVYVNEEFLSGASTLAVQESLNRLQANLEAKCEHFKLIDGSWEDAVKQVVALRTALASIQHDRTVARITVDATTFNRESLIVCLALLRSRFPLARVRLLYVAPQGHGPWLSRGYRKVRSVVGFSGVQQPSRPTILIILSGFEGDRTVKMIEEYEPTSVLLGIGDPPIVPGFLDRNLAEHKLVLGRTYVEEFRFPPDNTRSCVAVLERYLVRIMSSSNVVIAPMSTKLSTVATFIVAERYSEIQIAYCLPGEYNTTDYSVGSSSIYIEELE